MLDYLSRPVAFATAPLMSTDSTLKGKEGSTGSDTDADEPISKKISRGINLVKAAHSKMLTRYDTSGAASPSETSVPGPSTFPPPPQPSHAFDMRDDWDDDIRAFEGNIKILLTSLPDICHLEDVLQSAISCCRRYVRHCRKSRVVLLYSTCSEATLY